MASSSSPLVSTAQLETLLGRVSVLDCSWYLPAMGRNGKEEYTSSRRIPTASFFDINAPGLSDTSTSLPHMLPTPESFAPAAAALGISKARPCVVYDGAGLFSAARVWWTLKALGHPDVRVLNGGLPKWVAEGRTVDESVPPPAPVAAPEERWEVNASLVRSLEQVKAGLALRAGLARGSNGLRSAELLVDARPAARFEGTAPEPRPGLRSGHAPHSRSLPHGGVLDASAHNQLLDKEALVEVFRRAGVDVTRPGAVVTSCGSGVTGSVLLLALVCAGRPLEQVALYDGSWAEFGMPESGGEVLPGKAEEGRAEEL
jgi:thiosulfate/3-mercaptopyruvate sulfurtransferase